MRHIVAIVAIKIQVPLMLNQIDVIVSVLDGGYSDSRKVLASACSKTSLPYVIRYHQVRFNFRIEFECWMMSRVVSHHVIISHDHMLGTVCAHT